MTNTDVQILLVPQTNCNNVAVALSLLQCSCYINIQEGWLLPTEGTSVSAISLRHKLATSGESRRYVVAFTRFAGGGIWLPQESLRHILASNGYASGTIAVNITWMKRGFKSKACQTHSMYASIFNCLAVIQPVISKVCHFSCFAHFGLPWVRPWDNRGKCYMDGNRI